MCARSRYVAAQGKSTRQGLCFVTCFLFIMWVCVGGGRQGGGAQPGQACGPVQALL